MELFYTVSSQEGNVQSKPTNSLGGFCSSSKVPNGSLENLFSEISVYGLQNPQAEYIGLILKNTWGQVTSLSFWMNVPGNSMCKFKIAVVSLTENGEMEMIPSVNSKPLYAEFEETSQQNPLVLTLEEPFEKGQMLGLWLERTINTEVPEVKDRNNCEILYQMFKNNQSWTKEETVSLNIDFNGN